MKSSRIIRIGVYSALVLLCLGAAALYYTLPPHERDRATDWQAFYDAQPKSLAGQYLAGRHAAVSQDFSAALTHIRAALERAPNDRDLIAQAMQLELMNGYIEQAVPLALRLDALGVTDEMALLTRALHHAKQGTYSASLEVLDRDIPSGLYILMRPLMRQWAAIATNPPTQPVSLARNAKRAGRLAPFIIYQEALMNDVLGFDEAAADAYSRMHKDQSILPFRLVEALLNYQARHGQTEEAQALLAKYLEVNPGSGFADEKNLLSADQPALVASVHDGLAELFFTSASILMGQESLSNAAAYLQMALSLNDDLAPALFMLASVYEQHEQYAEAIATYRLIADATPYSKRAQVRLALNLSAMGEVDAAIIELKAQAKRNPTEPDPLISLADTYRIEKRYGKAVETYSKAIALSVRPGWELYYARGISHERNKEWDKAEADFVHALSLEPEQSDVLNYLGYSLLDRGETSRYLEAKEMIERALAQQPYAGHIIDSMGWALFKTGEYEAAVEHLERAAELTPHDPTVNDHLGDAYWRVGRKIEAQFQWERALTFDPDEMLREVIESKLENGLQQEKSQQEDATATLLK